MSQHGELIKFVHEKILVVDDDPDIRTIVKDRLQRTGYQVITAEDGEEALKIIAHEEPDAVILDLQMPRMNGMEVIKRLKDNFCPPIIVITAYGTIEKAVSAMKEGAFDFITKPFSPDHLDVVIKKAIEHRGLKRDNCYLQGVINASFPGIIGESRKIMEAMDHMMKYHWPGNVRELKNLMERAAVLADGDKITPHDLPLSNFQNLKEDNQAKSYHDSILYHQREVIRRALESSGGNQSKAAEYLHLQRTYLARLIKKLNIREALGGDL